MYLEMMKSEIVFISTGLFISMVTSAPTSDISQCSIDWTYGPFLSGWGCLRPIDEEFTRKKCLLSGYHITLLTNDDNSSYRLDNIVCVTDEKYEEKTTNNMIPSSITQSTPKTKLASEHLENSKELIAKSFGCCLQGLGPSG